MQYSHPESLLEVGGVGWIEEIQDSFLYKGWCVTDTVTVKDTVKWFWSEKNVWASIDWSKPLQTCDPVPAEHVWTQRVLIQWDQSQRIETDSTYWVKQDVIAILYVSNSYSLETSTFHYTKSNHFVILCAKKQYFFRLQKNYEFSHNRVERLMRSI